MNVTQVTVFSVAHSVNFWKPSTTLSISFNCKVQILDWQCDFRNVNMVLKHLRNFFFSECVSTLFFWLPLCYHLLSFMEIMKWSWDAALRSATLLVGNSIISLHRRSISFSLLSFFFERKTQWNYVCCLLFYVCVCVVFTSKNTLTV